MNSEKKFVTDAANYTGRFCNAAANVASSRKALFGVALSFAAFAVNAGALPEITSASNRIVEMNSAGVDQAGPNKDLGQRYEPVRKNGTVVHITAPDAAPRPA